MGIEEEEDRNERNLILEKENNEAAVVIVQSPKKKLYANKPLQIVAYTLASLVFAPALTVYF